MAWSILKRKRAALKATRWCSIDRFSHKAESKLGRSGLLHGFELGMHAGLAACRSITVQNGRVAHLVEESTQTAELGRGFADIISPE